jgi:hypothetical protein
MKDVKRWKGLRALIGDAIEHGASAVERVHVATAKRPFTVMEQIPGLAEPVKGIHAVHDVIVTNTYSAVRLVNRAVGQAIDAALDAVDEPVDEAEEPSDADTSRDPSESAPG